MPSFGLLHKNDVRYDLVAVGLQLNIPPSVGAIPVDRWTVCAQVQVRPVHWNVSKFSQLTGCTSLYMYTWQA